MPNLAVHSYCNVSLIKRDGHRARSTVLSKSDFVTDCLFCRLPVKDGRKKEMMLPTKLVVTYQEKLAQVLDGHRTNGQKPCADALYHSQ